MPIIEDENELNVIIESIFSKIKKNNNSLYFKGESGELEIDSITYKIKDIETIINNQIICRFKLNDLTKLDSDKCNLKFTSIDGFYINVQGTFYKNFDAYKMKGLNFTCQKGEHNEDILDYYSIIENLNIDESILDFGIEELSGVELIKYNLNSFPNADGYFHKKDRYSVKNDIKNMWESLYFLLKLYSAGKSSNSIECICSENYQEITISRFNLDFIKNHDSCFYVNEKDNLLNFIKYSFPAFIINNKNNRIAFKSFIHYMSIINGNTNDFDLLNSFVALEILAVGNGILMDDENFLLNRLNKLLNDLGINKVNLNEFFKGNLNKLNHNDYLICLKDHRNKILHGADVENPHELSLLVTTFLTIIFIRLLNVNCLMYIPILNKKCNTKEFIENFCRNEDIIEEINNENNLVKIFEYNENLYLPLDMPNISDSIKINDRYRIITFKTLGDNGKCLRNIKIDKK